MYFPTAEIHANPLLPPAVAFVISFFTSMAGVSGAFLLLPFQMSILGYVNASVSATNQLYNVFANPGAIARYAREQRLLWPLAWLLVAGSAPGVVVGVLIRIIWLPDPRLFKLFVGVVLLCVGIEMCLPRRVKATALAEPAPRSDPQQVFLMELSWQRLCYSYAGRVHTVPVPGTLLLSFVVGVVGGVYGIGGGAILAPFLVSLLSLPVHTVAGCTLFATCLTSVVGVLFALLMSPFFPGHAVAPDWLMAALLSVGGFAGMYMGARCQKFFPGKAIRFVLLLVLLGTGGLYVVQYVY